MPRPKGLAKTGGRTKGTPNRKTREQIEACEASGLTPLEYMLSVLRDVELSHDRRMQAAISAAPYVHHRLSSSEHSGPGGGPVQLIVETGFAYGDSSTQD